MAKNNNHKSKIVRQSKRINGNNDKIKLKECVVNLTKMSEHEYEIYSKSDIIKTANFQLKISGNHLQIGDHGNGLQTQYSEARIFNITLKKRLNSYILENSLQTAAAGAYEKFSSIL